MKRMIFILLLKQVLLFGVFYLALNFYYDSDFNSFEEAIDVTIVIVSGNTGDGKLVLDKDPAEGWGRKKVTWSIGPTATNVKSFEIKRKDRSSQLFKLFNREPRSQTRKGDGRLKNVREKDEYEYSIIWYDYVNKDPHVYDPKIAVKPSPQRIVELLINIAYAVSAGLVVFMALRKR